MKWKEKENMPAINTSPIFFYYMGDEYILTELTVRIEYEPQYLTFEAKGPHVEKIYEAYVEQNLLGFTHDNLGILLKVDEVKISKLNMYDYLTISGSAYMFAFGPISDLQGNTKNEVINDYKIGPAVQKLLTEAMDEMTGGKAFE